MTANYWISQLKLQKHPEGGYFSEVYRSDELLDHNQLPSRYSTPRCFSTSIYFLLIHREFSAFHRLKSDEIWHFYDGNHITIHIIYPSGILKTYLLGRLVSTGHHLQVIVPRNCWFAAEVTDENGYALAGCTLAPGFDFADFELADKHQLASQYPNHSELIHRLTR